MVEMLRFTRTVCYIILPHFVFHSEMSRLEEGSGLEMHSKARGSKARGLKFKGRRLETRGLGGSIYRILGSRKFDHFSPENDNVWHFYCRI